MARYGESAIVGKRYYDPEERRQRRMGAAMGTLAVGGAAGVGYGGYDTYEQTRRVLANDGKRIARNKANVDTVAQLNRKLFRFKQEGESIRSVPSPIEAGQIPVVFRRRGVAALGAGSAALAGAYGLHRHANSNSGRTWR